MHLKKTITMMTLSGVLLSLGGVSTAFAETVHATDSKVLNVQVKKTPVDLISDVV